MPSVFICMMVNRIIVLQINTWELIHGFYYFSFSPAAACTCCTQGTYSFVVCNANDIVTVVNI